MADARSKAVINALADLYSRTYYGIDLVTNLAAPLARGDSVEVPSIASLTVTADGSVGATPQAVTTSVLSLSANLQPAIFVRLPALDQIQLLDSSWAGQVSSQGLKMLKSSMDQTFMQDYLATSLCWVTGSAATYHDNVAGDALNEDDILNSKANLLANDGTNEGDLMMIVSPYGQGSIMSISGFVPYQNQQTIGQGRLGIDYLGTVFGVPVYVTNSILRNKVIATSAVTITSNVATATVLAGHGFVPGMPITNAGLTNSATNTTAQNITSTTSTTIVFPYTAADGAQADGVGTLTDASSWNIMCDRSHMFVAQQRMPTTRIVQDYDSTDDALHIWSVWGRIGRAGRARVIHSPGSNV